MKHSKRIRMIAAAVTVALSLSAAVLAASYDSSEDPLISLSYLTNIFKPQMEKEYEEKMAALEARIALLENNGEGQHTPNDSDPTIDTTPESDDPLIDTTPETEEPVIDTRPSSTYEVIELSAGDALYAVNACDIMVRSGSAVCIAPDASQGIADYTDGTEIYNEQALARYHMHLIPRGDGRGIRATSDSVYVMVRGDYTIVEG